MCAHSRHEDIRLRKVDADQVRFLKKMSTDQRLTAAFGMHEFARRRVRAFLEHAHPEWTEEDLAAEMRRRFSR